MDTVLFMAGLVLVFISPTSQPQESQTPVSEAARREDREVQVPNQCIFCRYVWKKEPITMLTQDLKALVYGDLDAEFSSIGKIADKKEPGS